jgi:hexosaminidase
MDSGAFAIGTKTAIHADGDGAHVARVFSDLVRRSHGWRWPIAARTAGDRAGIVLAIDPTLTVDNDEAYVLEVSPARARVRARSTRGLQHGAVALWQLMFDDAGRRTRVPALHIEDAPRFGWRGLMLDSARHFRSVDEVKRVLDAMVVHKLNVFHWHLTDDQGWRIEIKRYPKLTEVGGCRQPSGDAGVGADGKPIRECGWYTQAQIREIVRYAAARNIEVVPEIDVPGHATAMIAAYPELGATDTPLVPTAEWGVFVNLLNTEEDTLVFLEHLYAELADLFPGRYVHIGGDEAVKDQWIASPRIQAHKRALGLQTEMQLQGWMVARIEKALATHQRRLIGWDEILEADLPASATVMSWRGIEGGLEAASRGHDVVMSPVSHLYLDYHQTTSPNEPSGRPTTIPLRKLYAFEPIPAALPAEKRHHILGLQANVWTEHMRTFAFVEHAMYPRMAALAEVGWSAEGRRDYADFLTRLPTQLQRYRALGIGVAQTPLEVRIEGRPDPATGTVEVALSNALEYDELRYTTDGRAPTATSPRYTGPLRLRMPADVRAAVFVDGRPLRAADRRVFDAASVRERTDEELSMCTGALTLKLEDDTPRDSGRAIFQVDIFKPCWSWKDAPLAGARAVEVRAGRIPYFFQLAGDEAGRTFEPARTAHGELLVRAGCTGEPVASVPLPPSPGPDGFIELRATLPAQLPPGDLCLSFTGDTRPTMWVLDRVRLRPR